MRPNFIVVLWENMSGHFHWPTMCMSTGRLGYTFFAHYKNFMKTEPWHKSAESCPLKVYTSVKYVIIFIILYSIPMSGNQFLAGSITGNDPFDLSRISLNNGLQQGDFYIGPQVSFCSHPVKTIKEYIAKCDTESEDYVILKTLHCSSNDERRGDCSQGKVLLHNEHLILSLLQDSKGVIHHHGLFKYQTKFILVLDCLMTHEFDKKGRYKDYINLQHYVINKKRLQQREALEIFCAILATLKDLHQVCNIAISIVIYIIYCTIFLLELYAQELL